MRKHIIVLTVFVFAFFTSAQETKQPAQQIQHEAMAINIEVPVRVFKGQTFVDNLTIDDFEIYEDGVLQDIEAVYFIRKTEIERKEIQSRENKDMEFAPDPSRTFALMFEIIEYLPQIGEVLDHLFENVIRQGDSLIVTSPTKTYNLNRDALERIPREVIAKQLKGKLRQDANLGSSKYRSLVNHINTTDEFYTGQEKAQIVEAALRELKDLTHFDVKRASEFAEFLKAKEGQKQAFFFFQKRTLPIPPYISDATRMELLNDISFDSKELERSFADSSLTCHFLYITKTSLAEDGKRQLPLTGPVKEWLESGAESYRGFSEMADVTGGLIDTSANASASFKRAVDYSESYYLLYYSPKGFKANGEFKKIKVRIKGENYRITHRSGYVAD